MMNSVQFKSSSSIFYNSFRSCYNYQDFITKKKYKKKFNKRFNFTRYIKTAYKTISKMQNVNSNIDIDNSQNMSIHDSNNNNLKKKYLFEFKRTHCSSTFLTITISSINNDKFLYSSSPQFSIIFLSIKSIQTISKNNANINTITVNTINNEINITNA